MAETQGRITCDRARSIQNLRDAIRGYADFAREFSGAHAECVKFFGEMFAGMNCGNGHTIPLLMVIHDFYVRWSQCLVHPLKTNPPLIVDANAELSFAITN
jgi:hypothetical protein